MNEFKYGKIFFYEMNLYEIKHYELIFYQIEHLSNKTFIKYRKTPFLVPGATYVFFIFFFDGSTGYYIQLKTF